MSIILSIPTNPSKSYFATPIDSSLGVPNWLGIIISLAFLGFVAYVIIKVWISLREDKRIGKKE